MIKSRRIAIIPARGGSKRLPDKNIRDFFGKPMIGHMLETATNSGLFDVIHVSTEDARIQSVVEELGYSIRFTRPEQLADDHTPLMPVLKHVVDTFAERGQTFDQVVLLMACSPLIEPSDLQVGAALYDQFGGQCPVLSVASFPVPVEWAFSRRENGLLVPMQPGMFATRSQDLPTQYYDAGCFSFFPVERVLRGGAGDDRDYVGLIIPRWKAVDIDDAEDWELAEKLFTKRAFNCS